METNIEMNQKSTDTPLTSADIAHIKNGLTDDRFAILKAIYDTPDIQHKALCEKLNKKPNNLSNMLGKIDDIKVELIVTTKIGAEKYYTLTPAAKQYVEQELIMAKQVSEDTVSDHRYVDPVITEASETLDLFKIKCGPMWNATLYALLSGNNVLLNEEQQQIYHNLLNSFYACQKKSAEAIQQIYDSLEDEKLISAVKGHLHTKFFHFNNVKPIVTPSVSNITHSFEMIDDVFFELHPLVFVKPERFHSAEHVNSSRQTLSTEQYHNLLLSIAKLYFEFTNNQYTKRKAVSNWVTEYFLDETIAFYIAEKCSFLTCFHGLHKPENHT